MHDTCSGRLHISFSLFFLLPSISAIKKRDATLNFCPPCARAVVYDRFTNTKGLSWHSGSS